MFFSINRLVLLKNLSDVQKSISYKTTIPILTGVKIETVNNQLILTGSDASISIQKIISNIEDNHLNIENEGQIVLPSKLFIEIIKKLSDDIVTISLLENNQVEITGNKSVFKLNGQNPELYPKINKLDNNHNSEFSISSFLLKQILSQTIFSASLDESRPILTGINLTIENNFLYAISTDSHRMCRRVVELNTIDNNLKISCTIPAKSLNELSKIIDDNEKLNISISDNKILFYTDNLYFYSRLLEGSYPDITRLLKNTYFTEIDINSYHLLKAVERASIFSTESKKEYITLSVSNNKIKIYSESTEVGFVEEEVEFLNLSGNDLTISFNPNYMKDALRVLHGSDIKFSLIENGKPFTIKALDDEKEYFMQLITPIRTGR